MALTQRINHTLAPLDRYVQGVQAMRANGSYYKYVFWHSQIGGRGDPTDPAGRRNAAHRGPIFLPWHRELIWRFERDLQVALVQPSFGLPYWNWAIDKTDGTLATSRVWTELGSNSGPLSLSGSAWHRMSAVLSGGSYTGIDLSQRVRRDFDGFVGAFGHVSDIPGRSQTDVFMRDTSVEYDSPEWNILSSGFRNTNERTYHDHPHVLVGGDDGDMSSPPLACNDPIFFIHHAMIDRLWAWWQQLNLDAGVSLRDQYHPTMSEAAGIQLGHRIDETMWPWNDDQEMSRWGLPTEGITPAMVLDHRSTRLNYVYDDQEPDGCLPTGARILREILRSLFGGRGG